MKNPNTSIIKLGSIKQKINFDYIKQWKSDIFSISEITSKEKIPEPLNGFIYAYSDKEFDAILPQYSSYNLIIGITSAQLENNFYIRRIGSNRVIFSLFEMDEILKSHNIKIENFILKNIYAIICAYLKFDENLPEDALSITHPETRGCLFDKCVDKKDAVISMENPKLCIECKNKILESTLPDKFISTVEKELLRTQKSIYIKIADNIRERPFLSVSLSFLAAFVINLFSGYIVDIF